ncbi:2OG-Fe dioxygenase family protein [Sediminicoccus sp. KRV36]|uniref:2OG-Fe dioxygenase family protein n=1 Tax=Sediminicoccus sp. KRV36 TaxID=3133721 RepID=UPI00200F3E1A|nr:2OG-Fe dioxygenase family protein [Sediminicoccus rosea]UPY37314.1 2OG-Fe dioxygenase family protein [Sediminicoccus rosea]
MSALAEVVAQGFARLPSDATRALLGASGQALNDFASSWQRLEMDGFMADGGRYRRRRLANFLALPGRPGHDRGLHRPHFQASVHNKLNGGVDRWFAPVEDAVARNPVCGGLLALGRGVADALHPDTPWFVEMHQFRVEAAPGTPGLPTPEGVHHDGVDVVLIAMLARTNLQGGETLVTDDAGMERARFTLDGMLDLAILDDHRVMHGVTPVEPANAALPSSRDVLVLTWKRLGRGAG